MSNYSAGRGPRPADPYPRLRLAALTAVIAGVVLLAAAAFVLSYPGIHQIALRAGVSPELAKLYPVIFDAMLVVSGAAILALRGASWWARAYAWSSLLLMLVVVAVGDALHTTNVTLPAQPTRAVVAVTPWVLLLLAFGLWLEMLQHFRRTRSANGQQGQGPAMTGGAAAAGQGANGVTGNGNPGAGQRTAVTWASAGGAGQGRPLPPPLTGLDALLGPREGPSPATAGYPGQPDAGQYPDPVSYGEETGYVHPDSYLGLSMALPGGQALAGPVAPGPVVTMPAEAPSATAEAPVAEVPVAEAPVAQAPAAQAAAAEAPTAQAPATEAPAAEVSATAEAPPGAQAAPTAAEESQPAVENSPGATAQTAPAGGQDPRGEGGEGAEDGGTTPEAPAPDPGPPLERLRSTPAPPTE